MSKWALKNNRLQSLLLISLILLFAIVTYGTGSYIRNVQTKALEESFHTNSEKTFSMLFATSLDAVLSEDQPILETIVAQSVGADKEIYSLSIVNEFKQELAGWKSDKELDKNLKMGFQKDVMLEGETFGTIAIVWDVSKQRQSVADHVRKIWMFTVTAFLLVGILVIIMLVRLVVAPIQTIHSKLMDIQADKAGDPVSINAARELDELAHTVNDLGDLIELKQTREKELEETAKSKGEFLANMSHELRTPMNGVLGMLNLLSNTELDTSQRDCVDTAVSSGKNLLSLINDILDFSKIEAGRLEFEEIDFDLIGMVEGTCSALATQAHSKGLELVTDLDFTIPHMVNSDPTRVRQVLTNLMGNAIKFTTEGEIILRTKYTDPAAGMVTFEVIDSGVGISQGAIDTIFDSFAQADGSTTRKFGGTGLGLSISKQLVEGLGGKIEVTSVLDQGSTFAFTIPFAACTVPAEPKVYSRLAGSNLLLLDANDTSRNVLQKNLELLGATVGAYGTAVQGLKHMMGSKQKLDAILLSANISDMNGVEFVNAISGDPNHTDVKIVTLVYMNKSSNDLLAHNNDNVEAHLTKPVKLDTMHKLVGDVISGVHEKGEKEAPTQKQQIDSGRVLVVEDNEVNQMVAMGMLESIGYEVDTADNGVFALEALEESTYDIILMDCQMPEMDGYEATKRIRKHSNKQTAATPIIALTANAMSGDAEKCLAAGMDDYLSKPFEPEVFEQKMFSWTNHAAENRKKAA